MYYYMVLLAVVVLSHILFVIHYNPQILSAEQNIFSNLVFM